MKVRRVSFGRNKKLIRKLLAAAIMAITAIYASGLAEDKAIVFVHGGFADGSGAIPPSLHCRKSLGVGLASGRCHVRGRRNRCGGQRFGDYARSEPTELSQSGQAGTAYVG
jgi:hypothetical protein